MNTNQVFKMQHQGFQLHFIQNLDTIFGLRQHVSRKNFLLPAFFLSELMFTSDFFLRFVEFYL